MHNVFAFFAVSLVLVAVPGPDFAVVTRNAMGSRRYGVITAFGIANGLMVHAVLAGLGLSALLLASSVAFTVVKIVGALYLGYLGVQALMATVRRRGVDESEPSRKKKWLQLSKPRSSPAAFRQGLLTNVLNPKAVLVFISLLPQFVPNGASRAAWTAGLAAILVTVALVWFCAVAVSVAFFKRALERPKVERGLNGATALSFLGFGTRLILERR